MNKRNTEGRKVCLRRKVLGKAYSYLLPAHFKPAIEEEFLVLRKFRQAGNALKFLLKFFFRTLLLNNFNDYRNAFMPSLFPFQANVLSEAYAMFSWNENAKAFLSINEFSGRVSCSRSKAFQFHCSQSLRCVIRVQQGHAMLAVRCWSRYVNKSGISIYEHAEGSKTVSRNTFTAGGASKPESNIVIILHFYDRWHEKAFQ